jgi:hypothetical protein
MAEHTLIQELPTRKITEMVDAPNWIVGCLMPDVVLVD